MKNEFESLKNESVCIEMRKFDLNMIFEKRNGIQFGLWLENGLVCGRREGVDPLLGEEVQPFQSAKSQRSVKTEMALSLRVVVEIGHCLERHATCFLLGTCRDLYKRK